MSRNINMLLARGHILIAAVFSTSFVVRTLFGSVGTHGAA